ncbi:hypothetical protein ABPG74_012990 [Tetrahymena malaccensis]
MAFVYEKDRGLSSFENQLLDTSHLGPGRYVGQQYYKQNKGYAPFLSTTERDESFLNKKNKKKGIQGQQNQTDVSPGPGSYELSKPLVKGNVQTTVINDQTIVLKVQTQGSSNFRSTVNRFQNTAASQQPGPGSYNFEDTVKVKNVSKVNQINPDHNIVLNEIRLHNMSRKISSIPARTIQTAKNNDQKSPLNKINTTATAASNRASELDQLFSTNQSGINVGPGEYEIKSGFENQNKKPSVWSKSKVDRFDNQKHVNKVVGPGRYYLDKKLEPRYKKGMSASFRQQPRRTLFDQIDVENSLLFGRIQPEPASYNIPSQFNENNSKKPFILQNFCSTSDRFKENDKGYNLDPGHYQQKPGLDIRKPPKSANISFQNAPERDDQFLIPYKIQKEVPGVGVYDINQTKSIRGDIIKRYHMGYKGKFGSHQPRFRDDFDANELPGPGQYTNVKEENSGNKQFSNSSMDFNSFFKSQTQRDPYGKKDSNIKSFKLFIKFIFLKENIPSCGEYSLDYNTINYKTTKQKLFIENLKKIDVEKPGFDSKKPRFDHYEKSTAGTSQNMTPKQRLNQTFDENIVHKKCKSLTKESDTLYNAPKRVIKQPFVSKVKKIDYIPNQDDSLGPGIYESKQDWMKRSFNVKYQKK